MPSNLKNSLPLLLGFFVVVGMCATLPAPPDRPRYAAADNPAPRSGGTFVFHHETNVRVLDPAVAFDTVSTSALRLIFDQLLDYEGTELVPSLAEAMPEVSDNGRRFRFRLRRGAKFQPMPGLPTGREVTAEDISYGMHRMMSKEVASPGYPFYSGIVGAPEYHAGETRRVSGIRVIDRYTLEFQLSHPDVTFLNVLALHFAAAVPRENVEHWGDEIGLHPVGAGPFAFERWERGVEITFTRHRQYWSQQANADRMVYLLNVTRELAALRFRNGDVDHIHRLSPADYLFFRDNPHWAPFGTRYASMSTFAVGMNCQMEPWTNRHLRRAVAFALNRPSWNRARADRLVLGSQILPPNMPGHDPNLAARQFYDLERAREEMRLAGYPDGLPEPITVWTTGSDDTARAYNELLRQDLAAIGIQMETQAVSFATYLTESGQPGRVQTHFTGWNQDFPDPINFLEIFHSSKILPRDSPNRVFYENPEVDRLIDAARGETNRQQRLALLGEAHELIVGDAPWAVTYYPKLFDIVQPYVRGFRADSVVTMDFRNVWLDLPKRRVASTWSVPHGRLARVLAPLVPRVLQRMAWRGESRR